MGKPGKSSCSWFLDFWTCPWLPKPIMFNFGYTKRCQLIQEKSRIVSNKYLLGVSKSWISNMLKIAEQTRVKQSRRSVQHFRKSWIWDQYLHKNMKWNLVMWDQYLSKNMKWEFDNLQFEELTRLKNIFNSRSLNIWMWFPIKGISPPLNIPILTQIIWWH